MMRRLHTRVSLCYTYLGILLICLATDVTHASTTDNQVPAVAHVQLTENSLVDLQDCRWPNSINVTVKVGADVLTLHLQRNPHVDTHAQTYLLKEGTDGRIEQEIYKVPQEERYGLYVDKDEAAAVLVTCPENGGTSHTIEGDLNYKGSRYHLKPGTRSRRDVSGSSSTEEEYILLPQKEAMPGSYDYRKPPPEKEPIAVSFKDFVGLSAPPVPSARRRRQTSGTTYFIDVIAVVDFAVYRDWHLRSTKSLEQDKATDAIENIRRYFAFIMNGVDLRYQSITSLPYSINIRLIGYVIAQSSGASPWTESVQIAGTPRNLVDADKALTSFSNWASSQGNLPQYDHAVLFSGYDLYTVNDGQIRSSTTGLAYIGALCSATGKGVSVVEEVGGFESVETTAHEIGHSIGAYHDGDNNTCSSADRFIMSAGTYQMTTANKLNNWKFSSCSIDSFRNFFTILRRTSRGRTCLDLALPSVNVPSVAGELPGQLYDPDAQCRQIHGQSSRLCRGPEFGAADDICTRMYCYDPSTAKTCFEHVAARGTTCGDKKWCIDGQCVYSPEAPSKSADCLFGDQPGIAFDNKDCNSFTSGFPGYCNQAVVRGRCCSTCQKYYRYLQNCEYGDKVRGCSSSGCGFRFTDGSLYDENCCGTCNYGSVLTPTTTVRQTQATRPTTPAPTVVITTSTTTTASCEDSNILVNGQTCTNFVNSSPASCYDAELRGYCCGSCQKYRTNQVDCEYGDRNPGLCRNIVPSTDTCTSSRRLTCCATCRNVDVSSQPALTSQWKLVILLSLVTTVRFLLRM